ncbi:MAG: TolC family protein [Myxococcota bacterium]
MRVHRILPALIAVAAAALADEGAPLGLRDAIASALERNADLAREAVNVGVAEANIGVAHGPLDFRLGADVSARRSPSFLGNQTEFLWDIFVGRRLPTAGDLELRLATELVRNEFICQGLDAPADCTAYTPSVKLELRQPLLRGGWPMVMEAPIRKAEIARTAAAWRRAARAGEMLRDVVSTYWEVAYAAREVEIRHGALALARKQLELTRAEIAAGRLAPADSLGVERAIVENEEGVILAENALLDRSITLRRLMGERVNAGVAPYAPSDEPRVAPSAGDPRALAADALARNPTLLAARADGRVRAIDVEVARRGTLPTLNAIGSIGEAGRASSYGDAVDPEALETTWAAGLSFVWQIGDRSAHGAEEIARLEQRRVSVTVSDLEADVAAQVARLTASLRAAAKRVEVVQVQLRLAQQNLEAEEARFTVGRVRNQDVLNRQEELRATRLRGVRAAVDYLRVQVALDAVTGAILERYGVAAR